MRKIISISFCIIIFPIAACFAANPPKEQFFPIQSISLTYDLDKHSLDIEAAHPSQNWEIDYVRMMTISVNGQGVFTQNYYHQTSASGFSDIESVTAQVGDVITVDLFCTAGSSLLQDLTVAQGISRTDQGAGAGTDSSTTNTAGN